MRPEILISGVDGSRSNYEAAVRLAGGTPVSGYCPTFDPAYSGLILAGGGDVDPRFYHGSDFACKAVDRKRDLAEFALIRSFLSAGRPIFGICRGMQILNIFFGGTLVQDLGAANEIHCAFDTGDRVHPIRITAGSPLPCCGRLTVNSAHHQAVDRPGHGVQITARSEDGVAEALCHARLPVEAVQFHPERLAGTLRPPGTADGLAFFVRFLSLCQTYGAAPNN